MGKNCRRQVAGRGVEEKTAVDRPGRKEDGSES